MVPFRDYPLVILVLHVSIWCEKIHLYLEKQKQSMLYKKSKCDTNTNSITKTEMKKQQTKKYQILQTVYRF